MSFYLLLLLLFVRSMLLSFESSLFGFWAYTLEELFMYDREEEDGFMYLMLDEAVYLVIMG